MIVKRNKLNFHFKGHRLPSLSGPPMISKPQREFCGEDPSSVKKPIKKKVVSLLKVLSNSVCVCERETEIV